METQAIKQVLASPCTSYWLANALRSALGRDCVDAIKDAALLAKLLDQRTDLILYGKSKVSFI